MARRQGEEVERCKSVSTIQRMIGGKWKIEILFYIALKDVRHFGQLRRCIGNISESTLSKQLRELVDDGFLVRTDFGEVPPRVEYTLTPQGESFVPILLSMKQWGEKELRKLQRYLLENLEKSLNWVFTEMPRTRRSNFGIQRPGTRASTVGIKSAAPIRQQ